MSTGKVAAEFLHEAEVTQEEVRKKLHDLETIHHTDAMTIDQRLKLIEMQIRFAELSLKIERSHTR